MTWQLVPTLVLVLLITSDCAQAANRICGSRLAEVLAVVCRGRGYYWEIEKRTVRNTAQDINGSPVREKRSVVQECCHRTCSISELESYCNVGDGLAQSRRTGRLLGRGTLGDNIRTPSGSIRSSSSSAAAGASRQRFTLGLLSYPFFFVTPRRTGGLLDAAGKK